jgi:hypothetical protein
MAHHLEATLPNLVLSFNKSFRYRNFPSQSLNSSVGLVLLHEQQHGYRDGRQHQRKEEGRKDLDSIPE